LRFLTASLLWSSPALAWDSESSANPTRPTHTLLTRFALDKVKSEYPKALEFRQQMVEGANYELHDTRVRGTKYGAEMESLRAGRYVGTNAGCDRPELIWEDSLKAYREGEAKRAFFLLGVLLHQVEDMGVPSHAHGLYHEASLSKFDNFEYMALWNWKPDFAIVVTDPRLADPKRYADPSAYYEYSRRWTLEDAPAYKSCDSFSKTWSFANASERQLLSRRQGRTAWVTAWALRSALEAFALPSQPESAPARAEASAGPSL
jgi:hypothetical protein